MDTPLVENRGLRYLDADRTRHIDLSAPPEAMWDEVIRRDGEEIRALADTIWEWMADRAGPLSVFLDPVADIFAHLLERTGARHGDEVISIADRLGIDRDRVAVLQRLYSLSHLGCTTAIRGLGYHGMTLVRTLDWGEIDNPAVTRAIANATRIFKFHRDSSPVFTAVGIAGCVGILSGMVPGCYAAAINWAANPQDRAGLGPGEEPLFRLREVLSGCDTYADAVAALQRGGLSSSVYMSVCGAGAGEGCTIEYARIDRAPGFTVALRRYDDHRPVLALANHYVAIQEPHANDEVDATERSEAYLARVFEEAHGVPKPMAHWKLLATSRRRQALIEEALGQLPAPNDLREVVRVLDDPECLLINPETCQAMVCCPGKSELHVWARINTDHKMPPNPAQPGK